ncbi:MAG: glycosyltransferase [Candidatus Aenigmatarchaeota archaeon]
MKVLLISPEFSIKETKGLARYAYELYSRLKNDVEIDLVFRKKFHKGFLGFIYSLFYSNFLTLIKGKKVDVIHAVSPELGFLASIFYKNKTIVTFHDLFPILYWKKLKFKAGFLVYLLSYIIWKLASRAKIIVANSSLTKQQIEKVFKRYDAKIILEGIDRKKFKQIVKKEKNLTLCFVGNYSFRKRVDLAIKLYRELKKKTKCKLFIVGGKLKSVYYTNFDLSNLRGEKDIVILDKVDDKKLIEIYSKSHFLIFPSIVEGFGLPILEALSCNTLAITFKFSDIPKEIKALSVECENLNDAITKILEIWKNKKLYKDLLEEKKKELSKFDWNNAAKEYLKLYKLLFNYGKG